MRVEKIGGYKLEFYDSIDELPAKRFHKFNKYLLIDASIGGDLSDVSQHIGKAEAFIAKGEKEKALKQLRNLRQSIYQIADELHVGHLAFMLLIKTINGKPFTDLSDENIRAWSDKLLVANKGFIERLAEGLKKKIEDDVAVYFPGYAANSQEAELLSRVRSRALLQLDAIIKGQDNSVKIRKLEQAILTMFNPLSFTGKESAVVKYEKQFMELVVILQDGLNFEVDDETTVLEMYSALERLKKKFKPAKNGREPAKV